MTTTNEKPGRNEPCPCGSGQVTDPEKKKFAREIVRLRMVVCVLLRELLRITGRDNVTIPDSLIAQLPRDATFEQQRIKTPVPAMQFTIKQPEKPQLVAPSKRIILPGRGG
ncbi:MAG: hypothetical protein GWN87_28545 [Desulfuromonadales bacterium]|nr:hypothetical protein [Desulfuromonadales bacterium]